MAVAAEPIPMINNIEMVMNEPKAGKKEEQKFIE